MRKGRFTGLAFLSQDSSKESKLNISVILLTIVFFLLDALASLRPMIEID